MRGSGTFGLYDPPELDGEGDPVEEGGGEADGDGGGEEGAAAGLQHRHRWAGGSPALQGPKDHEDPRSPRIIRAPGSSKLARTIGSLGYSTSSSLHT